jgi:hypothetical protein
MCDDQDVLDCYFVPRILYRAFVPRQRLALCMDVAFSGRKTRREPTHAWVAEFFYEIFAVGADRADEVGQVEAILVAQGGCDQSQKLGVSYGHEFGSEGVEPKSNIKFRRSYQLHNKMALQPSLRPLLIAGKPDAPHTLDVFRM